MVFWTIQKREIVDQIMKEQVYTPDFTKSDFVEDNTKLSILYQHVLDSFNEINETNYKGLVFTFLYGDQEAIYSIEDIEIFQELITNRYDCIKTLWEKLRKNDCVILQVDMEPDFNPICIDINDFQFLIPPILEIPPYQQNDVLRLLKDMKNGVIRPSIFPSNIIQAHIPYIKKEDVVNIYEMFEVQ